MRRDFGVSQWEEAWGFRDASIDAARFVPVSPHFFFHGPPFFTAPLDFELLLFRLVDAAALKLLPCCFLFVLEALASSIPCLCAKRLDLWP